MNWFFVALVAYFLLAIVNLTDKFLVEKVVGSARAYTFIACAMGSLVLFGAPWFLSWPGIFGFFLDLVLGGLFASALLLLYAALRRGEASRSLVIIGGSTPIFSLPLSFFILGDKFSHSQLIAMIFLVVGVLIVAFLPGRRHGFWNNFFDSLNLRNNSSFLTIILSLGSGLAYALFFVGSKFAYQTQAFLSTFLWTRLGAILAAAFILFSPRARREIKALFTRNPKTRRNQGLVAGNQILGSIAFVLQNYAIYLGPVALVNALQGVQYAWIIILGALVSFFAPKILKEDTTWPIVLQKGVAILIISVGLYFLSL
jgi:drug/metabolite transporter (DMT)-like permease